MNPSAAVRVLEERVLSDDWFVLKKTTFERTRRDGRAQVMSRETYDRGNGAVLLLFNAARGTVILTRQFRFLHPAKNRSGNRVYSRREVELILLVKHLLYTEKYTIEGARQQLDERRRGGALRGSAREALARETIASVERELAAILRLLESSGADGR